jgi:hypothetical protein
LLQYEELTFALWNIRCGHPCSHVLKVTNELTLDKIKVQHWKIYALHYNNESPGIDFELKKEKTIHTHCLFGTRL